MFKELRGIAYTLSVLVTLIFDSVKLWHLALIIMVIHLVSTWIWKKYLRSIRENTPLTALEKKNIVMFTQQTIGKVPVIPKPYGLLIKTRKITAIQFRQLQKYFPKMRFHPSQDGVQVIANKRAEEAKLFRKHCRKAYMKPGDYGMKILYRRTTYEVMGIDLEEDEILIRNQKGNKIEKFR